MQKRAFSEAVEGATNPKDLPAEPELRAAVPRRVEDSRQTRRIRFRSWCVFPVGIFLAALSVLLNVYHMNRLRWHGIQTDAIVTSKTINMGRPKTYYVHFFFADPDHRWSVAGTEEVPKAKFYHMSVGDAVPVTYNAEIPEEYEPAAVATTMVVSPVRDQTALVTLGMLAIYACILVVLEAELAGNRRLLREGLAVVATVAGEQSTSRGPNAQVLYCQYRRPSDKRLSTFELKVDKATFAECEYGDKFTILLLPGSDESPVPYFRIRNAVVEGMPCRPSMPYRKD